jgi:hypothetical protein
MEHVERCLAGQKRKVEAIHAQYTRQIEQQQESHNKMMEATRHHYTQQLEAMQSKNARLELQLPECKADTKHLTESNAQLTASNARLQEALQVAEAQQHAGQQGVTQEQQLGSCSRRWPLWRQLHPWLLLCTSHSLPCSPASPALESSASSSTSI